MELKQKNNVLLYLWRLRKGEIYSKPKDTCELGRGGLWGLFYFVTSPLILLFFKVRAMVQRNSLVGQFYYDDQNLRNIFWIEKGIILVYIVGGVAGGSILELEKLNFYQWLYIPILTWISASVVLGVFIGILWILFRLVVWGHEAEFNLDSVKVLKQYTKNLKDKYCTPITWK